MAVYPETITYRDVKGQTAKTSFFVSEATPAAALTAAQAIVNAFDALTNGARQNAKGAYTTPPSPVGYGANAVFKDIEDKAVLTFTTASGAIHRYQVPAPVASLFLADEETVDSSNADIATLFAAMSGVASSRDGSLINAFIGGIRIRRRFQRRFNIFTKDPTLSGPGE